MITATRFVCTEEIGVRISADPPVFASLADRLGIRLKRGQAGFNFRGWHQIFRGHRSVADRMTVTHPAGVRFSVATPIAGGSISDRSRSFEGRCAGLIPAPPARFQGVSSFGRASDSDSEGERIIASTPCQVCHAVSSVCWPHVPGATTGRRRVGPVTKFLQGPFV